MTVTNLCQCGCGQRPKMAGSRYVQGHWQRHCNTGSKNSRWKGGRHQAAHGYYCVTVQHDDPMVVMAFRNKRGTAYVLEHRLVMARYLGRPLERFETVHHLNGDRADNRIENLQLRIGRHGSGQVLKCADCGSTNLVPVELAPEGGDAVRAH